MRRNYIGKFTSRGYDHNMVDRSESSPINWEEVTNRQEILCPDCDEIVICKIEPLENTLGRDRFAKHKYCGCEFLTNEISLEELHKLTKEIE